jgi:hypothetical protein
LAGGLATLAVTAARLFSAEADTRALDAAVLEAAGADRPANLQVRVGPVLITLARLVVALVPEVPEEARLALRAVRSAEVSLHQLAPSHGRLDRVSLLSRADAALAGRGLERVAGVVDGGQVVAVYVRTGSTRARDLSVAVLMLDGDQLITVRARADVEALAGLARRLREGAKLAVATAD